jgi:hypothetical protein
VTRHARFDPGWNDQNLGKFTICLSLDMQTCPANKRINDLPGFSGFQ